MSIRTKFGSSIDLPSSWTTTKNQLYLHRLSFSVISFSSPNGFKDDLQVYRIGRFEIRSTNFRIKNQLLGVKESYDCGLKLFLDKHDLERLYDFEEESMEGLVREREAKQNQTTDERIRLLGQRMDSISSKMDDSYQLDNGVVLLDSLESRLTLLEKAIERTTDTCIALHDCVISQESFSQPLSKQAASMTLSQATTLLAPDGETWTSTPILSDSSSSTSEDGQVYGRANESEKGCEVYRQEPNSADEPIRPLVRTKLERRSTTSRLPRKKVMPLNIS